MKKILKSTFLLLFIAEIISCQSSPETKNKLIGHWYVSKLTSHKKIYIDTPQTMTESNTQHFIFTEGAVYEYRLEENSMIIGDTTEYNLSNDNKILILHSKFTKDTLNLEWINDDEFSFEDNMGLIMTLKRSK
jgi:hypothetical protein